jgi:carbon monoxide dehydrogenase subunit G
VYYDDRPLRRGPQYSAIRPIDPDSHSGMIRVETSCNRICHPRAFREESGGQQRHEHRCAVQLARPQREPAGSSLHFQAGFPPFNHERVDMVPLWQSLPRSVIRHGGSRLLFTLLALAGTAALAAESPIRKLDVAFEGDAYIVNAVFVAPAPQSVAWDVLTDFDKLQGWVPNVAESKVVKRDDASVTVEQRGVAKYGAASFPYVTERRIELKPPANLKTAQIKGSMRRVESTIMLEPEGKGTRIIYHLEIVPSLLAGAVMSKAFVEHEVGEQFTAIVGEMTRRVK